MDNYKKIRSILLQLQIIGNGKYDDAVFAIQSCLTKEEPYTATNENVLYANAILSDVLQKEKKKGTKRVGKYMQKFPEKFTGTDEADDFNNDSKIDHGELLEVYKEEVVDESELFEGLL